MSLIAQGLVVTVLGMGVVFLCLGLLWLLMSGLTRAFPARTDAVAAVDAEEAESAAEMAQAEAAAAAELTAERARVAALVAAALMANALPITMDPGAGPEFEDGRIAPSWVSANRARMLQSWQPPRRKESSGWQ